jgi:ABC-type polysaccharide/polyol phosphate export permease
MATLNIFSTLFDIRGEGWHNHSGRSDIKVGLKATHVWLALGWHDIRQRYRRSIIGPFWFTLSTLIMVGVLGILYSALFDQEIRSYLPYLGVGLVIWQYISTVVNEGANSFIGAGYLIKQIRMPLTTHVARIAWRNFIILMHSLPVVFLFLLAFGYRPGVELFLLVPALFLLLLHGVWIGVVFGIICARYRDVYPIVGNLLMVAFFLTPVMWMPTLLKDRAWVAEINPLYHLIETVRAPMINSNIELTSWIWSIGLLVFGFAMAQYLMSRYRERVPYWL